MVSSTEMWPQLIPIVPRSDIYLYGHGIPVEERFVKVFRKVWRKLPSGVRRSILSHWQTNVGQFAGLVSCCREAATKGEVLDCTCYHVICPRIEVLPGFEGPEKAFEAPAENQQWAGVFAFGSVLRFHSAIVEEMPEEILEILIAQQLVYVHELHQLSECMYSARSPEYIQEDALIHAMLWGFDEQRIQKWLKSQETAEGASAVGSASESKETPVTTVSK